MLGTVVGSYKITGTIGEGGMGVVYGATHTLLGRPAAIKVLHGDLSQNQDIVNRFFNEARAATSIRHPGIVEVYDFGYLPSGAAYIAMEMLEGQNLGMRLAARRRLPVADALFLTRQMAGALAAAHGKGIIHRDLKPDNVFLVRDPEMSTGERIKLLDFGIAKLTQDQTPGQNQTRTGSLMGTPTYMSPEQCRGVAVDARSDLYSLGVILFEMLCGRTPFVGEGMGDVLAQHIVSQPPPPSSLEPSVPPEVDGLVLNLLAKDPRARPHNAEQLIAHVDAIAQSVGQPRPASFPGVGSAQFARVAPPTGQTLHTPVALPQYMTPAPMQAPPTQVPTTLSGSAASYTQPPEASPRKGGRGLIIGIAGAVVAGGIALAVVLASGGGGGAGKSAEPAAASPAPDKAPAEKAPDPKVEPAAKTAEPTPPPVEEAPAPAPVAEPEPAPTVEPIPEPEPEPSTEPTPEQKAAAAADDKKSRSSGSKKKKKKAVNRDRAVNPFD